MSQQRLLSSAIFLVCLSACSQAEPTVDYASLFEGINKEETQALQSGSAAGAASFFLEDGVVLPPDGNVIRGREAIRAFWGSSTARILEITTETIAAGGHGDTGFLSGKYRITTQVDTAAPRVAQGTFMMVFRRVGERWLIAQDMWTSS